MKLHIDWDKVTKLLQAHCSGAGISQMLGIHENTLYERCKEDNGMDFRTFKAQKQSEGKDLLRVKQFEIAMKGDKIMLIWLGKQYLEQRENADFNLKLNENKLNELAREFGNKVVSTSAGSYVPQNNSEILE